MDFYLLEGGFMVLFKYVKYLFNKRKSHENITTRLM